MIAGSTAGFLEHLVMFPVDTIKTRLQVDPSRRQSRYTGLRNALLQISQKEGLLRLYRGAPLVLFTALPSHACYFGAYEGTRMTLRAGRNEYNVLKTALSGAAATFAHDLVVTPVDVIKQRLQMEGSPFRNAWDCFSKTTWHQLYRSYPTTVMLNIPFVSVHFVAYESSKLFAKKMEYSSEESMGHHLLYGGFAGGLAGFFSTPLDVIRTRIQTDCECGKRPVSCVFKSVWRREGLKGLFSGAGARTCYFVPSAAITWSVYEYAKSSLGWEVPDEYVA